MGNFIDWFSRSYRTVILVLVAIMAIMLVVLAMQHVSASRPAAGAEPGPIPTFTSEADTTVRAVFLGDSYVAGTGASTPSKRWTSLVADDEGWAEINLGQGATGYVSGGLGDGQQDQYASRIQKVKAANPDVVFVSGSQNDLTFPADQVAAAIRTTLTKIHKAVPDAHLVVVGPVNPGAIVAGTRANDKVVQDVAADLGATYISSIDPGSTFTEQGDYWTDGQHPSDSGHQHIADRVEAGLPDDFPTPAGS